tara:strand:- start:11950 stop:12174 length:225 start_codon:yes stop_codon:yes gene_type:complete
MLRNPSAIDDEVIVKLKKLLSSYEEACENILYKNFNITETVKDIEICRRALDYAENGPTFSETLDQFAECEKRT